MGAYDGNSDRIYINNLKTRGRKTRRRYRTYNNLSSALLSKNQRATYEYRRVGGEFVCWECWQQNDINSITRLYNNYALTL